MAIAKELMARVVSFLKEERAVVSVLFITSLPMFLVLAGLAIDGGAAYSMEAVMQDTADAAALAAALHLRSDTGAACGTGVNGSNVAETFASTNLPASTNGTVLQAADCTTGYWNFNSQPGTYESCGSSTITCADNNPVNAVRVLVRREQSNGNQFPISFMKLMGWDHWDLSALAIAAIPSNGGDCFLQEGTSGSVSFMNGDTITTGPCGAAFDGSGTAISGHNQDSVSGAAVFFSGSPGYSAGVSVTNPVLNAPLANDPYANTPLPPVGACNGISQLSNGQTANPGTYCGNLTISGTVTFNPGTYVFNAATISLVSATINATGAGGTTLFLTGSGNNWTTITATSGNPPNNNIFNITAPSSGNLSGIAIFGSPKAPQDDISMTFKNNVQFNVVGAIYLPTGEMTFKNNVVVAPSSSQCMQLVVSDLVAMNNWSFGITENNCNATGVFALGHAKLVQ